MDSFDAFVMHEARQAKALAMRPKCGVCKEPIQSDEAICYDGDYYCEDCKEEFIELMIDLYTERIN